MKDGDNGTGRIARLELGSEWMCKQVVLSPLLVFVQSIIDDELEVRALTRGRGGGRLSMRHEGEIRWFVRTREDDGGFVGDIGDRAEGNTLGATLRPGRIFPSRVQRQDYRQFSSPILRHSRLSAALRLVQLQ